ncbi:hypothetical protein WN943_005942 [Citrus x changshan-huyou]
MTKIGREPETKCMKMIVTEHEMKIAKGFVMKVILATNVNVDENKGKQVFQNGLDEEFATFKTLEPSIQNIIDEAYMEEFMMQRVRFSSQAQAGNSDEPQPANSIKEKRRRMKGKQVWFVLVFASRKNRSEAAAAFTSLFSSADQTTYRGALNKKLRHTNSSYLDFIRWVSFREADQDLNTEHPPSDEQ